MKYDYNLIYLLICICYFIHICICTEFIAIADCYRLIFTFIRQNGIGADPKVVGGGGGSLGRCPQ